MSDDTTLGREGLISRTFVELADTLVADFDVIEMLSVLTTRSVELLAASAAGLLLADSSGHLRVVAASTENVENVELFQIQNDEGPCMDCFSTGEVVVAADLAESHRWPMFAAESLRLGYRSVCAVPLRLRSVTLGCMNLFIAEPVALAGNDIALAQALADMAAIAILQERATRDAALREQQLQHALDSRIRIEQAKGIISQGAGVDMDESFGRLRSYARDRNLRLGDVAQSLVEGRLAWPEITRVRH